MRSKIVYMLHQNLFISKVKARYSTLIATAIGVVFGTSFIGPGNIFPWNISWLYNKGDGSSNQLVFQFFRQTPFLQWPITAIPNYVVGANTVNPDGNALFSTGAKFIGLFVPGQFQYFGIMIVLWFALQALFAERLLSRFIDNPINRIIGSLFFLISPAFVYRISPMQHFHVAAHWLVLAAFYLYFDEGPRTKTWALLNAVAVAINIYMAAIVAMIFCASVGKFLIKNRIAFLKTNLLKVLRVSLFPIFSVVITFIFSGYLTYRENSFGSGRYRLNVFSFLSAGDSRLGSHLGLVANISPRLSAYLQADSWEGFQYLGLGIIAASPIMLFALTRKKHLKSVQMWLPLIFASILLFILALSDEVMWAPSVPCCHVYWPSPVLKFHQIFRGAPRFGIALYYLIMVATIVAISKVFKRKTATIVAGVMLFISIIDVSPLLRLSHNYLSESIQSETLLRDSRWSLIAAKNKKLVIDKNFDFQDEEDAPMTARVFSTNWFELAQFAVDHQMSTNFGYVSRPIGAFVIAENARVAQELSSGKLDPDAIYLVSNRADWIKYQKRIGNSGNAYELDGFFVLVGN